MSHHCSTPTQSVKPRKALYALQHPGAANLFYRLDGDLPRLTSLGQACLAPATPEGLEWLTKRATRCAGDPHEVVRLDV